MTLAAALLLATLITPERPVTAPAYGPAFGTQYPHELVSDGTDFLAVWTGIDGVHAAAIDENGKSRAQLPRALFTGTQVQAAWAGDAYALAWLDGQRTMFARVSRDAELIMTPVAIADGGVPAAIASLGDTTLVVLMRDERAEAVLVGPSGAVLRSGIPILPAIRPYAMSAAASGGGFVVATLGMAAFSPPALSVHATRVSASGDVEQSVKLIEGLESYSNSIDAAGDGERVGVAFVARRNTVNGTDRLYAFTLDARTLAVTAHDPVNVSGDDPQVVPTPRGFAAVMLSDVNNLPLKLTTVAFASGMRQSTDVAAVPGANLHSATNGRRVLSVWRDYRFSPPYEYSVMNLFGLTLDSTAMIPKSEVQPVTISVVAQTRPVIATAGDTALVVWLDLPKTVTGNLVAARVDSRGNVLDAEPIVLATDIQGWQRTVVVFTGEVWIVAWTERNASGAGRAFLRRISRDGQVLDATPVAIREGGPVAAASNGTVTLLIAGRYVLHFSRAGERLDESSMLAPERQWGMLASNGSEFLYAWNEGSDWWQMPSPNLVDVRAMRFDASGAPMDAAPIDVAVSSANEVGTFVTSNGTDFLVLYERISDARETTVRAKRVLRNGNLADHTATDAGSAVAKEMTSASFAATPREDGYVASIARVFEQKTYHELVTLDARGAAIEAPIPLGVSEPWAASTWIAGNAVAYSRTEQSLGNIERVYLRAILGEGGRRRTIRQ